MLESILPALVSAAGSFLSGSSARSAAETNAANNIALQKEFAKNAIQWKVADAEKAGIHPLYALGASTTSFSPVSVGSAGVDPLGGALSSMGQDLSRAAAANRSPTERLSAISQVQVAQGLKANDLRLSNMEMQNQLLAQKVRQMLGTNIGPGGPEEQNNLMIPGQGNTAGIDPEPLKVSPAGSNPSAEAGSITDIGYARTTTGWAPIPSKDIKERIEDNIFEEGMHFIRNRILPNFGYNLAPPPFKPPPGQMWIYSTTGQEYRLVPITRSRIYGDEVGAGTYIR